MLGSLHVPLAIEYCYMQVRCMSKLADQVSKEWRPPQW